MQCPLWKGFPEVTGEKLMISQHKRPESGGALHGERGSLHGLSFIGA